MSTSVLSQLQAVAQEVSESKTPEERIAALTQAFDLFSQETIRLETAYQSLQQKFATVNVELQETNRALNDKVGELDMMTTYLNSIVGNMTQGLLFVDLSGDVTTFNRSAERMLGLSYDKVLLKKYWESFGDDFFGFSMQTALATGEVPASAYVTVEGANPRELEVSTTFVLHGDESMQGLILLMRDITELRRLQTIASRDDRMKELGAMAASVAHEIRNPLGGIKGFASLLCRDLEEKPEMQQMAQYIVDGATTLDRLVTDVLNYSRPLQMHIEVVDIVENIRGIIDFVRADQSLGDNISIDFVASKEGLCAPIDQQMFKAVLLNLIVNGAQAMKEGGVLKIACSEEKGCSIITVADTGVGITAENLEKIFSPFFTTKTEGNGFGLSEVHKIIQAHGGDIDVVSEVGEGTTFTIKLPLKA